MSTLDDPDQLITVVSELPPGIREQFFRSLPPTQREFFASELETRRMQASTASTVEPWFDDPVLFVADVMPKVELAPYQAEILTALAEAFKVGVRGPRGLGKSGIAGIAIIWFAVTRDLVGSDWKIVTTAGAWSQLENYLWPEVRKWAREIRWARIDTPPWKEGRDGQFLRMAIRGRTGDASAASPVDPNKIEGLHGEEVLVVYDESKTIPDATFDALEGAESGVGAATNDRLFALVLSTPGAPVGRFHEILTHKKGREDWTARHVTIDEAIAAGRVTVEHRDRLAGMWGTDSALYRTHVLGEFAADDEMAVIEIAWIEAAFQRWEADPPKRVESGMRYGLDVAAQGKDASVLTVMVGHDVIDQIEYDTPDLSTLRRLVQIEMGDPAKVSLVTVDADGMGAAVADELRLAGYPTYSFHGNYRDNFRDETGELELYNQRTAAWWHARGMLDPRHGSTVRLKPSDKLLGDLNGPRWLQVSKLSSTIRVEVKEETKKRLGRSPDHGDSCIYGLWEPPVAPAAPAAASTVDWMLS